MAANGADYILVEATEGKILERKVARLISENWLPQGGITIVNLGNRDFLYAQAMTFDVQGSGE